MMSARRLRSVETLALAAVAFVGAVTPFGLGGQALAFGTGLTARMVVAAPPDIVVPDVVGLKYQEAQVELAMLGPGGQGPGATYRLRHDATVPAGDVIAQSVTAGTAVAPLTNVALTVSVGPAAVPGALPCRAAALTAYPEPRVSEATGQDTIDLALTNKSAATCELYGYPSLVLLDKAGRTLPFSYSHAGDQMTTGARPRPVYLFPGRAAWIRVNKYRCDIAATDLSHTIVLGWPRAGGKLVAPASFTYCAEAPSRVVTVSPFEPIELLLAPASLTGV